MAELLARKTEIFLRLARDGQVLFDGAAECVTASGAAVPVAIASGALRHEIEQILDGAGLLARRARHRRRRRDATRQAGARPLRDRRRPHGAATAAGGSIRRASWPSRTRAPGLRSARAAGLRTVGVATSYPAGTLIEAERILPDISHVSLDVLEALVDSARADTSQVPR